MTNTGKVITTQFLRKGDRIETPKGITAIISLSLLTPRAIEIQTLYGVYQAAVGSLIRVYS